ncbi:hypothetical protein H0H92_010289, partial [Tricholoma furcatifolium]
KNQLVSVLLYTVLQLPFLNTLVRDTPLEAFLQSWNGLCVREYIGARRQTTDTPAPKPQPILSPPANLLAHLAPYPDSASPALPFPSLASPSPSLSSLPPFNTPKLLISPRTPLTLPLPLPIPHSPAPASRIYENIPPRPYKSLFFQVMPLPPQHALMARQNGLEPRAAAQHSREVSFDDRRDELVAVSVRDMLGLWENDH